MDDLARVKALQPELQTFFEAAAAAVRELGYRAVFVRRKPDEVPLEVPGLV